MSNSSPLPAGKSNTLKERATEHVDPEVCYDVIQVIDQLVINQEKSKQIKKSLDELNGKVEKAIKDGTETANKHERRLNKHGKHLDEVSTKVSQLETISTQTMLSIRLNTESQQQSQKQNIQLIEGLGSRMDNFFTLLKESQPTKSSKPKPSILDKVPLMAWVGIAITVSGTLVYVITGDDSILKLGVVK